MFRWVALKVENRRLRDKVFELQGKLIEEQLDHIETLNKSIRLAAEVGFTKKEANDLLEELGGE